MKKTRSDMKALRWILKYSKPQIPNILFLVIVYAVLASIGVYTALLSKNVIDSAVSKNVDALTLYSCIFGGVLLFQLLLRILSKNLFFYVSQKTTILYRTVVFKTIISKDYFGTSAFHSGELLNRLTEDVSVISDAIVSILPAVTFMLTKLIGVFWILFSIDWRFTLVFLLGGISLFIVIRLFKGKMKSMHKRVQESEGKVRSFIQEIISNLLVVKVFSAENKIVDKAVDYQKDNYKIRLKRNRISILATCGFSFIFSAAYLYGLIWGAFNIVDGVITYGTLTALLSLISQIQGPISQLSGVLPKYYSGIASAERLMDLNNINDEVALNMDCINTVDLYNALDKIQFKNITFKYDREVVLDNTSLTINKGDFVVIMGVSGIGKSTLTKLLMGVYPITNGKIELLCNNGNKFLVDKNTRTLFSYVPQGNFLLSGTIRENISFVNENATEKDIMKAVKISCSENFINELPMGLDTIIGEKGQGLSEGQIQRIAIARAILTDRPILILDEATSALDEATEKALLTNIKNLKNKTCIIISHKTAAASMCNRHLRIQDAKIVEDI